MTVQVWGGGAVSTHSHVVVTVDKKEWPIMITNDSWLTNSYTGWGICSWLTNHWSLMILGNSQKCLILTDNSYSQRRCGRKHLLSRPSLRDKAHSTVSSVRPRICRALSSELIDSNWWFQLMHYIGGSPRSALGDEGIQLHGCQSPEGFWMVRLEIV